MLTLRGYRDKTDFAIVARIQNKAARRHRGEAVPRVDAGSIERTLSTPERLCIATVDEQPAGFVYVARVGAPQLDEFGTVEGKSWLVIGPTRDPERKGQGIEQKLLNWMIALARDNDIATVFKFARATGTPDSVTDLFGAAGFRERISYYSMRLEMVDSPSTPRELGDELDLVSYKGDEDFDLLWGVLEPAFGTTDQEADAYEQTRAVFSGIEFAYFPICVESATGKPVGTIALTSQGDSGGIATFGVVPDFHRRGIGSLLMQRALDHAWKTGVRTLDLAVRVENPQAIGIYERFGFVVVPERTTVVLEKEV